MARPGYGYRYGRVPERPGRLRVPLPVCSGTPRPVTCTVTGVFRDARGRGYVYRYGRVPERPGAVTCTVTGVFPGMTRPVTCTVTGVFWDARAVTCTVTGVFRNDPAGYVYRYRRVPGRPGRLRVPLRACSGMPGPVTCTVTGCSGMTRPVTCTVTGVFRNDPARLRVPLRVCSGMSRPGYVYRYGCVPECPCPVTCTVTGVFWNDPARLRVPLRAVPECPPVRFSSGQLPTGTGSSTEVSTDFPILNRFMTFPRDSLRNPDGRFKCETSPGPPGHGAF